MGAPGTGDRRVLVHSTPNGTSLTSAAAGSGFISPARSELLAARVSGPVEAIVPARGSRWNSRQAAGRRHRRSRLSHGGTGFESLRLLWDHETFPVSGATRRGGLQLARRIVTVTGRSPVRTDCPPITTCSITPWRCPRERGGEQGAAHHRLSRPAWRTARWTGRRVLLRAVGLGLTDCSPRIAPIVDYAVRSGTAIRLSRLEVGRPLQRAAHLLPVIRRRGRGS